MLITEIKLSPVVNWRAMFEQSHGHSDTESLSSCSIFVKWNISFSGGYRKRENRDNIVLADDSFTVVKTMVSA